MFAWMTVRLPDPLRRAGAYLKAFALLEDVPLRVPADLGASHHVAAGPTALVARSPAGAGRERRDADAHAGRQSALPPLSHRHRRPPRIGADRLARRRAGSVPAGLQPCCQPIAAPRVAPARAVRARCSRSGSMPAGH